MTVAGLHAVPETGGRRYEVLDGVLLVSPAPTLAHQRALLELMLHLDRAATADLQPLLGPFAVRPDGRRPLAELTTELRPDAVVAPRSAYADDCVPGPPLLVVEVCTAETRLVDEQLKRFAYERMAVPSFWLLDVDADPPEVIVYELDGASYRCTATARGHEVLTVARPFPITICPADLLSR